MERTITVDCPECGKPDTTTVQVDDFDDFYITTSCLECLNPYALRVEVSLVASTYKLTKA
jgi:translation initiation factor 2 beta subunit (eIF-2beta)/eIF-5